MDSPLQDNSHKNSLIINGQHQSPPVYRKSKSVSGMNPFRTVVNLRAIKSRFKPVNKDASPDRNGNGTVAAPGGHNVCRMEDSPMYIFRVGSVQKLLNIPTGLLAGLDRRGGAHARRRPQSCDGRRRKTVDAAASRGESRSHPANAHAGGEGRRLVITISYVSIV